MKRWFILFGMMLLVTACSVLAGDTDNSSTTQTTNNANSDDNALVRWDRDPLAIVFQADVLGGPDFGAFFDGNRVPLCTIYGDGRLVWLSPDDEVLFDFLTDQQISDFVTYLTVDERFFTYESGLDTLLPSPEFPVTDVLMLNVNGIEHTLDSFGNWTEDYFERLLTNCTTLSQQPRRFQPSEGWLSVEEVNFNSSIASELWFSEAAGLSMLTVADSPSGMVWLDNNLVLPIWTVIRDNDGRVLFDEDGDDFLIVLQVPGVTVDAPPPPTAEERASMVTEEPDIDG